MVNHLFINLFYKICLCILIKSSSVMSQDTISKFRVNVNKFHFCFETAGTGFKLKYIYDVNII